MSESEMENPLLRDEFRGGMHDTITEVDLFFENCSSLYNLILDSIHDLSCKSISCQQLDEMSCALTEAGKRLTIDYPDMEGTVGLRINTISSAMEQLKLRRNATSDTESCSSRSNATSEIRSWIHSMENRLKEHEGILKQRKTHSPAMTKLLADQQVLQLEIQTDGQSLISKLYQLLRSETGTDVTSDGFLRKKSTIDAIRKKWHTVYLHSLSLQFKVEEVLNQYQEDSESETDPDLIGPPTKRRRHYSLSDSEEEDTDTLPFADSEYESIMDGRATVASVSSEDSPVRSKKWGSVQQDIGYSSGENSIHEALNTIGENSTEDSLPLMNLTSSPANKGYYQMMLDEVSDVEIRKALDLKNDVVNQMNDSMHVNYEQNSIVLPEYDEVMALLDDEPFLPKDGMSDSFNTKWREIRGRQSVRKSRISREMLDQVAKNSCDASSEDSSDWEAREDINDVMSRSFNSALMDNSLSLKRNRGSRKGSNFLLDCSEMDASFCSTRSDLPPCLNRSLRKRLRVRRMPRSMSDGEQLGVKSGLLTPQIRVSPPGTPLSRSTRLLQKLDQQLIMNDSDTAPEHSDAPAYEWDDYNPPAKDDSVPDVHSMTSSGMPEDLMNVDDDFTAHFGNKSDSLNRLLNESCAHLGVVERCIESGDVDPSQTSNIELICRTNLRQLDSALLLRRDASEVRLLRDQWARLLSNATSPASQLLNKIGRFANSLRDLHETSPISVLNGISEIKSKEDARTALNAMQGIQKRLSDERDELRSLVGSKEFRTELSEISSEFDVISIGYDEAVNKIEGLVTSLDKLNNEWTDWSEAQQNIRGYMSDIEEKLKSANFDQGTVMNQMELCQERMNSLETMCNYLTSSLQSIQEEGNVKDMPDFKSEIMLYANALEQLKSKFHDMIRVPSPPTPSTPLATSTPLRKRVATRSADTQTSPAAKPQPKSVPSSPSLGRRLYNAVSSSRLLKGLLALSLFSALAALFWAGILGRSFGPHLTYVNGPPPM